MIHRFLRKTNIWRQETGSSMIEFAILFPVLLLLFAGAAEVGRLLNYYTTLAKATEVGARYLSIQDDSVGTTAKKAAVTTTAQNLVVCGMTDCTGQTSVVSGLTTANVLVTLPVATDPVRYVKVEIQNYTLQPGAFNLAHLTGSATNTFYFSLTPATKMRYMP